MDPNSADPFATFKDHSKGQDDIGAIVEAVAGAVVNVVAIAFPGPWSLAAAAALDTAQAGQSFAGGNVLGGVLSLASALGVGLNALGNGSSLFGLTAGDLGLSAAGAKSLGAGVLAATALAGGTDAVVQAAQRGDGLGIAAGLLQVAAAAADGTIAVHGGGSADLKLGALGLSVAAGATRLADGAQTGDLATALADVGALAAAIASAVQQANTDPQVRARVDQFMVADARLSSPGAGQGGTLRDVPGPVMFPGTSENEGFVHDTIAVLKYLWNIISGGFTPSPSLPIINEATGVPPPNLAPEGATRDEALAKAKEDHNIPKDEEPEILSNVRAGKNMKESKILRYLNRDGEIVDIRHDYGDYNYPDDPNQNRGPHFNWDIPGTNKSNHYDYNGSGKPLGLLRR